MTVPTGKADIIDLVVHMHHRTDKAVLISDDGDREEAVWLPLSQIEMEEPDKKGYATITCPEWLAYDKGLI